MKTFRQLVQEKRSDSRTNKEVQGRPSLSRLSHFNQGSPLVQSFRNLGHTRKRPTCTTTSTLTTQFHLIKQNNPLTLGETQLFTNLIKNYKPHNTLDSFNSFSTKRPTPNLLLNLAATPSRDPQKHQPESTTAFVLSSSEKKEIQSDVSKVTARIKVKLQSQQTNKCKEFQFCIEEAQETIKEETERTFQRILNKRNLLCSSIKSKGSREVEGMEDEKTPRFELEEEDESKEGTDRVERSLIKSIDEVLGRISIPLVPTDTPPSHRSSNVSPLCEPSLPLCNKMQSTKSIKNKLLLGNRSNNTSRLEG